MQHFCILSVNIYMRETFDEKGLILKILSGDQQALRQFIDMHQRLVSHIVFRMIPIEREREDICQNIFIKIYQNLGTFHFQSKLSTWIGAIAYNTCLNYLEKKKIPLREDIPGDYSIPDYADTDVLLPDAHVEREDTSIRIRRELMKLPAIFRTILTLFYLDELSYREIGAVMDLPEGTVKSYLFRGRKYLKDRLLRKYQPEEIWQ